MVSCDKKCGLPTSKTGRSSLQPELSYRAPFLEIIDTIVMQMKQRFESVKDIAFIELLDCKHFHLYDCYRTNALFKQVFFKRVRRKSNCGPGNIKINKYKQINSAVKELNTTNINSKKAALNNEIGHH